MLIPTLVASFFVLTETSSMPFPTDKILCILYSSGGTADVGRHAVKAALDATSLSMICVLTQGPKDVVGRYQLEVWLCSTRIYGRYHDST